jgi:hypothetical protein
VRCVNGSVELTLDCRPLYDYGRIHAAWDYAGPGYGSAVGTFEGHDPQLG